MVALSGLSDLAWDSVVLEFIASRNCLTELLEDDFLLTDVMVRLWMACLYIEQNCTRERHN